MVAQPLTRSLSAGVIALSGTSRTVGNWLTDLTRNVVYPSYWGAGGGNAAQDTAAFQAMAAAIPDGTIIDLGGATYYLSGRAIFNQNDLRFQFKGATFLCTNQYDAGLVFTGSRVRLEKPRFIGTTVTRGDARQYWIDTNNTAYYGVTSYSRATTLFHVNGDQLLIEDGGYFENLWNSIYIAGAPLETDIRSHGTRLRGLVFYNTDFGILATNQDDVLVEDINADTITMKTTLPPHGIYFTDLNGNTSTRVRIRNVMLKNNDFDSAVKLKRCPDAIVETVTGESMAVLLQLENSPRAQARSLTLRDQYASQASTTSAVQTFVSDNALIDGVRCYSRTGESNIGILGLQDLSGVGSIGVEVRNAQFYSARGVTTGQAPINIDPLSSGARLIRPSWEDTDPATQRHMIACQANDLYVEEPRLVGGSLMNRFAIMSGTAARSHFRMDASKLQGASFDTSLSIRNTGTGTGHRVSWVGRTLQNLQITAATATLDGSHDGSVLRANNATGVAITLPNDMPVGARGRIVQTGAGAVSFSAASGASIIGATSTAGQYNGVAWEVINNSGGSGAQFWLIRLPIT